MDDYTVTLLSQYAQSPRLLALIDSFNAAVDPSQNIDNFYSFIWNVDTAFGWGLKVWGRIVGITNIITLPAPSQQYFGFEEGGTTDYTGFNQVPFYPGPVATQNYAVSDKIFRQMILAKALTNITDRSIPSINKALMILFPGKGNAYVTDDGSMQCTYTFTWKLMDKDVAILKQTDVIPGPTGANVLILDSTGYR